MPAPRLPLSIRHRSSCLKNNDQDPDRTQQNSHEDALVFFQYAELKSAQSRERERSKQNHSGHRCNGENRGQDGKAAPSVTDSRNVKRHKAFAGRESEKGEEAHDRGSIRSWMSLARFIVVMAVFMIMVMIGIIMI